MKIGDKVELLADFHFENTELQGKEAEIINKCKEDNYFDYIILLEDGVGLGEFCVKEEEITEVSEEDNIEYELKDRLDEVDENLIIKDDILAAKVGGKKIIAYKWVM